jgi:type IV pilus assembly protein PilA
MAVVAIVAILATLATYGVNKYIQSSKSSEAIQMIGSIKAAQEQYRAETFAYKDVGGNHTLTYYPKSTPSPAAMAWGDGTTTEGKAYRELGVSTTAPVRFVYGCAAGAGADAIPAPGTTVTNWPSTSQQPWYVVQAKGDLDGDGITSTFVSSSFAGRIFTDKDGE